MAENPRIWLAIQVLLKPGGPEENGVAFEQKEKEAGVFYLHGSSFMSSFRPFVNSNQSSPSLKLLSPFYW